MTSQSHEVLIEGRAGGPFDGHHLVGTRPHHRLLVLVLRLLGARQRGTSWVLPSATALAHHVRIEKAFMADETAQTQGSSPEYRATCARMEIGLLTKNNEGKLSAMARDAARRRLAGLSPEELAAFRKTMTISGAECSPEAMGA